MGQEPLES